MDDRYQEYRLFLIGSTLLYRDSNTLQGFLLVPDSIDHMDKAIYTAGLLHDPR